MTDDPWARFKKQPAPNRTPTWIIRKTSGERPESASRTSPPPDAAECVHCHNFILWSPILGTYIHWENTSRYCRKKGGKRTVAAPIPEVD